MATQAEKDTIPTYGSLGRPTAGAGVSTVSLLLATVH